jgi:hypothetical protein
MDSQAIARWSLESGISMTRRSRTIGVLPKAFERVMVVYDGAE